MGKRFLIASSLLLATAGIFNQGAIAAPITFNEYNVTTSTSVTVQLTSTGGDLLINVDGFGINVQAGPGVSFGDKAGVVTDGTRTVLPQGTVLPIVQSLAPGTVVGASDTFTMLSGFQNALLDNTARNGEFPASPEMYRYFGFEVIPSGSTTPEYGYVTMMTVNDGATTNDPNGALPYAAQVASVTYDPTGASLSVVPRAIPEPASVTLLGLGGLALMRRQRRTV